MNKTDRLCEAIWKGWMDYTPEQVQQLRTNNMNKLTDELITKILKYIDAVLTEGHGGGNWRRLVEQLRGNVEKYLTIKDE